MANPNWIDKWSSADLERLVYLREIEKKTYPEIEDIMGFPEASCARRYRQIVAGRPPEEKPKRRPYRVPEHVKLGIDTYTHLQAILFDSNGIWGNKRDRSFQHWYRVPVTLAKVFA